MTCEFDFEITQGAVGLAERLEWRLAADTGVDFLAFASRVLTMQVAAPSGSVIALAPWVVASVATSLIVFRYTPLGTEFPELGNHIFIPTLALDATTTRYRNSIGKVIPRW